MAIAGFTPVQDLSGHQYTGKIETYPVSSSHSTALAVGDIVTFTGTADTVTGLPFVDAASGSGVLLGPITSVNYNPSNIDRTGVLPALTAGFVQVAVDRQLLMVTQLSTTVTATKVQLNYPLLPTACTTFNNGNNAYSNMKINTAGAGQTAADQLRLEAFVNDLQDGVSLAAGATVYVRINQSTLDQVGV